jgi:hypothetical protein
MPRTLGAHGALFALLLACLIPACGGSDDGADLDAATSAPSADAAGAIDAGASADATTGGADAATGSDADPGGGSSALGSACFGFGQDSNCPDGYECVSQGGSGWCTKECAGQADRSCEDGYEGPGFPSCNLDLTLNDRSFRACSIICSEETGGTLCPEAEACTGECPSGMACESPIRTNQGQLLGHACA